VLKVREERRSKQALLAVTDPTLAAKRKLDKKKKTLEAKKKRRVRF
jgi:U3 small nucleolar RNA-associated protein 20